MKIFNLNFFIAFFSRLLTIDFFIFLQVSSSEYFSVSFEVGNESGSLEQEEFLPALKGTFLV